jgi:hypothetical protein
MCLCSQTADKKKSKWTSKHHFFDVMSEVQKDLEDISTGIGKFKKSDI